MHQYVTGCMGLVTPLSAPVTWMKYMRADNGIVNCSNYWVVKLIKGRYHYPYLIVASEITIRQHSSAVYVRMVVVVCIPQYNGKPPLALYRALKAAN